MPSRDGEKDRQIGDRRFPNMAGDHIDGPSKTLPQGQQLTFLRIPRFTHMLRGSMTDRRDFITRLVSQRSARAQICFLSHFPFWTSRGLGLLILLWTLGICLLPLLASMSVTSWGVSQRNRFQKACATP